MGDIGDRDRRGSQVTPRATGVAAVVSVALGLAVGAAAWALSRTAHAARSPVADGMFCAFTIGAFCFVLWQRRVEGSRAKYRWRELKPSDPFYRTWRDLRERSRLLTWSFVTALALGLLLSQVFLTVQREVLNVGANAADVSSKLYKARRALGVAKWNELALTDTRASGLDFLDAFERITRDLGCARLAVSCVCAVLLVVLGKRMLAWPCPRCAAPFVGHRRSWYLWVALAMPTTLMALVGVVFFSTRTRWDAWAMSSFFDAAFFSFASAYFSAVTLHKFRDNYARRHGDPQWQRKVTRQCVHCGLDVWTPALPTDAGVRKVEG
jgi:FtsH-binding integral membrane protein